MQRPVNVIIPFKHVNAKSRLAPVLSLEERQELALAMLRDVLEAVSQTGPVTILSRPGFKELDLGLNVNVVESGLELNNALNALIEDRQAKGWPTDLLIVMADLALLTKKDLLGIQETPGDVVLSPGRGGGTNMVLIRSSMFRTCYIGISFPKHLDLCYRLGLTAGIYASYQAGCDIDNPSDIIEVLIHNQGETKMFLTAAGFVALDEDHGCIRMIDDKA